MGTLFYKNMQKNNKSAELENERSIRKWEIKENFGKKRRNNDYCTDGQMLFKGHSWHLGLRAMHT
jgi:hypothetical protein